MSIKLPKLPKNFAIFLLTIVIVVISIIMISILFSSTISKSGDKVPSNNNSILNNTTVSPIPVLGSEKLSTVVTNSGKKLDSSRLPYKQSSYVEIDVSTLNNALIIKRCLSTFRDNVKYQPDGSDLPADYQTQIDKALESLDISKDKNTFDTGVDNFC